MASAIDTAANTLGALVIVAASVFQPPERLDVAEAAAKYVYLKNPPAYQGYYKPDKTPYMIEPQNMSQSQEHTSLIFVGPSQTGKTEAIILNVWAYHVKCNPLDMLLYCPSQSAARDFVKRRIDRLHRNSKEIGAEVPKGQHADNTHDKTYRTGIIGSILWPSINELSSKPAPVVMFTEYDRMPDDVEGEGSPFTLGKKRTTTFRNMAMTIVDSSPARPVTDVRKKLEGHEAPPCTGILGLYNEGDRRRWYWPCPKDDCGEYFEPHFGLLVYQTEEDVEGEEEKRNLTYAEIVKTVYMKCPHCGARIEHDKKRGMNLRGVWLREGEKIRPDGTRYGNPRESDSISYWLRGPAATFITWSEMVVKYVKALRKYEQTGDDNDLKATVNTDQGEPYVPKEDSGDRLPEDIMDGAIDRKAKHVPEDVRSLMATVDVQKNRFEVQVMGVKPGKPYKIVVIDRFPIVKSDRLDDDGDRVWVKPASKLEDWDLIETQVMNKTYPLEDGSGTMAVSLTLCDSGGKEGVTTNAYNFWRKMRDEGKQARFQLVKGEPNVHAPRVRLGYPDSARKDRHANARGEVPVLFINTNMVKDYIDAMLDVQKDEIGCVIEPASIEFPDWLEIGFYEQLTAEIRKNGKWEKIAGRANESFDLLVYFAAGLAARNIERVDWADPPKWLHPWPTNPSVKLTSQAKSGSVDKREGSPSSFASLAEALA